MRIANLIFEIENCSKRPVKVFLPTDMETHHILLKYLQTKPASSPKMTPDIIRLVQLKLSADNYMQHY